MVPLPGGRYDKLQNLTRTQEKSAECKKDPFPFGEKKKRRKKEVIFDNWWIRTLAVELGKQG